MIDEGYDVGGALLADRDGIGTAAELRRQAVEAGVELLAPAIAIGLFESAAARPDSRPRSLRPAEASPWP